MEGKGRFMPGQTYVALSRVKNLNGLYLLGFDACVIRINPAVLNEMGRLQQEVVSSIELTTTPTDTDAFLHIRLLNIRSYREHLQDLKADKST